MSALAELREAPGLEAYLAELEDRLDHAVSSYRGIVSEVGGEALAAGGKRLRPLLVYLSTPPGAEAPVVAGVAVELVHLATLMHDDMIDGAQLRRGRASAWSMPSAKAGWPRPSAPRLSPPVGSGCGRCSSSSRRRRSASRRGLRAWRSSSCTWRPSSTTT